MNDRMAASNNELKVIYWGPPGSHGGTILERIAEERSMESACEFRRVRTRLDPSLHYEEVSFRSNGSMNSGSQARLIAVPTEPELAPVRLQLLDGADAVILLLDHDDGVSERHLSSVEELRRAFASYGRDLQGLPIALQNSTGNAPWPEDWISEFGISPLKIGEPSGRAPASCHQVLDAVLESLRQPADLTQNSASTEPQALGLAPEEDPWLSTEALDTPDGDGDIKALLEASILAEEEVGPDEPFQEEAFGAPTAHDGASADPGSTRVGLVEHSERRGIRLPLTLSGPGGEAVPIALRIELEVLDSEE